MLADRENRIRQRAYQIWLDEGCVHGRHEEHWYRAKRDIAQEENASDTMATPPRSLIRPDGRGEGDGSTNGLEGLEIMNDKDRWSAHLEYLKVAITLATAILVAAAAIYSDSSKVPTDNSKYVLLISAIFVFATLVSSILAVIKLSNYLIRPDLNIVDRQQAAQITRRAGVSFFCLTATGFFILIFFAMRTFGGASIPPANAISEVTRTLSQQIDTQKESLRFNSFEAKGGKYLISYDVPQTATKFQATVDIYTGKIE